MLEGRNRTLGFQGTADAEPSRDEGVRDTIRVLEDKFVKRGLYLAVSWMILSHHFISSSVRVLFGLHGKGDIRLHTGAAPGWAQRT